MSFHTFTVPLGGAEGDSQVGDCAHDATIGGLLADTGEKCTQDHVGRARGYFITVFVISWSTMGGIVVIDGYSHQTGFRLVLEYTANVDILLPICSETLPLRRWRARTLG